MKIKTFNVKINNNDFYSSVLLNAENDSVKLIDRAFFDISIDQIRDECVDRNIGFNVSHPGNYSTLFVEISGHGIKNLKVFSDTIKGRHLGFSHMKISNFDDSLFLVLAIDPSDFLRDGEVIIEIPNAIPSQYGYTTLNLNRLNGNRYRYTFTSNKFTPQFITFCFKNPDLKAFTQTNNIKVNDDTFVKRGKDSLIINNKDSVLNKKDVNEKAEIREPFYATERFWLFLFASLGAIVSVFEIKKYLASKKET